jgi:hypothetical protein
MSKNYKKKLYIGISILIILIFSVFWIITFLGKNLITTTRPLSPERSNGEQASPLLHKEGAQATVSVGNTTIYLSFTPNTVFYDALLREKNAGKITFSGRNYPGLGFFVTDIGTLHSGDGKNLLYYINGKEATVGVSLYKLKDGDIIEWKLK